jgi:hypothetical protein
MAFGAVEHLYEGLSLETLLIFKGESPNLIVSTQRPISLTQQQLMFFRGTLTRYKVSNVANWLGCREVYAIQNGKISVRKIAIKLMPYEAELFLSSS